MMQTLESRAEKIGWTAGRAGGFIWVAILSAISLFQGKNEQGLSGIALTGIAFMTIYFCSPWRFPSTSYWMLILAPYGIFYLSIAWAIWAYGGFESSGFNWWNFFWLLPLMIPLGSLSKRKWAESGAKHLEPVTHPPSDKCSLRLPQKVDESENAVLELP